MNGGNTGASYGFGGSVDPMNPSLGNAAEVIRFPSCGNAVPPGFLANAGTKGGLPGFAGGARRRNRSGRKTQRRRMNGGGYTFNPAIVGSAIALGERLYSGCGEGAYSVQNPLNQGNFPASVLTAPPAVASPLTMFQKGGAGPQFGVDAMVYQAPHAGWSEGPSSGETSAGPPFMIHTPYISQLTPSPACLKTGGGWGKKGSRKQKNRKNKNRKNKSRKQRSRK
jgi:hypothetical protein